MIDLGKKIRNFVAALLVACGFTGFCFAQEANAMSPAGIFGANVETSIINCDDDGKGGGMFCLLNIVVTVFTVTIGIAGILGITISGIQYMTSRDNPTQMAKAKNRLINIAIGLGIYVALYVLIRWLVPGF